MSHSPTLLDLLATSKAQKEVKVNGLFDAASTATAVRARLVSQGVCAVCIVGSVAVATPHSRADRD